MKRIALLAALAAGALVLAAGAQAKEIAQVKVCGVSACASSTDKNALKNWEAGGDQPALSGTNPGPFFKVTIGFGDGEGHVVHREYPYWLPAGNAMRGELANEGWWRLAPVQTRILRSVAGSTKPIVPGLSYVRVKGKKVRDADSYLLLLGKLHGSYLPQKMPRTIRIDLRPTVSSPWITGPTFLRYAPKTRLLIRPDGYFRVPKPMARRLMHRASLRG